MFESNPSFQYPDGEVELSSLDALDIPTILLKSALPGGVREATQYQTFERLIDAKEIVRLTETHQPQPDLAERLQIRRKALSAHKGSVLMCVLIRLPGVIYTVEIDPRSEEIVHWEWQQS